MAGNVSNKALLVPSYLLGYSLTIFIGTLITFWLKISKLKLLKEIIILYIVRPP